uniref:Uncharacterized protein n=1 Tax=Setaria digitata TaxID=48799 RepID=A0A915Q7Z7_9BILA
MRESGREGRDRRGGSRSSTAISTQSFFPPSVFNRTYGDTPTCDTTFLSQLVPTPSSLPSNRVSHPQFCPGTPGMTVLAATPRSKFLLQPSFPTVPCSGC